MKLLLKLNQNPVWFACELQVGNAHTWELHLWCRQQQQWYKSKQTKGHSLRQKRRKKTSHDLSFSTSYWIIMVNNNSRLCLCCYFFSSSISLFILLLMNLSFLWLPSCVSMQMCEDKPFHA